MVAVRTARPLALAVTVLHDRSRNAANQASSSSVLQAFFLSESV